MNEQKAVPAPDNKALFWLALLLIVLIAFCMTANGSGKQLAARVNDERSEALALLYQTDRTSAYDFSDCAQPG